MISVCIATYNGEKHIKEQLDSILSQLGENDEIIISDDNSVDNTINIIQFYNDTRIKVFSNKIEKKGYTGNFENALKQASGDIIFLSDQDDVWAETKVEYCVALLEKYDMIISDAVLIDEENNLIGDSFYKIRKPYKSMLGNVYKFGYLGCCLAFRRTILEKALPFPVKRELCTHDNWLVLIGLCFHNTIISSKKLIYYRRHTNNASSGGFVNNTSVWFKIYYRLYLIFNLIKRLK